MVEDVFHRGAGGPGLGRHLQELVWGEKVEVLGIVVRSRGDAENDASARGLDCGRERSLRVRHMFQHFQQRDSVKSARRKPEALGVHPHSREACQPTAPDSAKVGRALFVEIDGRHGQVWKCRHQWPEKGTAPAADIQQVNGSETF